MILDDLMLTMNSSNRSRHRSIVQCSSILLLCFCVAWKQLMINWEFPQYWYHHAEQSHTSCVHKISLISILISVPWKSFLTMVDTETYHLVKVNISTMDYTRIESIFDFFNNFRLNFFIVKFLAKAKELTHNHKDHHHPQLFWGLKWKIWQR